MRDQSRRPKGSPKKTEQTVEKLILELREEHPAWGARSLAADSEIWAIRDCLPPTVTNILHRHKLISPGQGQGHKAFERFERKAPNELWQMDFKGLLSSRSMSSPDGLDDHSRYNLILAACSNEQENTVQGRLISAFDLWAACGHAL